MKTEKILSRKEKRKNDRIKLKSLRNQAKKSKTTENTNDKVIIKEKKKSLTKKLKIESNKNVDRIVDPYIEEEEKEIKRLESLLGIKNKDKDKIANKLNKEYEQFEGIKGSFGKFLMELDEIAEREYNDHSKIFDEDDDNTSDVQLDDHIVSDNEQEKSDIEDDNMDDEDVFTEDVGINDDDISNENYKIIDKNTYKPTAGEDIYGRIIDSNLINNKPQEKYLPPAARLINSNNTNNSEVILQRQINGLLNKLSDQSKDGILNSLQDIYSKHSVNICNSILNDVIYSVCINETQIMTSLIPIYAGIIAGLHFTIGVDVGAYIIEQLATQLYNNITIESPNQNTKEILNKMLLLVYLYNLRVINHQLIINFIELLTIKKSELLERDIELIVIIIDHCGIQIRSDDPVSLKNVISYLLAYKSNISNNLLMSNRLKYMLDSITDLKNNKSRRIQNVNIDVVKSLRKWLGNIKSKHAESKNQIRGTVVDICLNVTLRDLLDANSRGRWWKAGASWVGNNKLINESNTESDIESNIKLNEKSTKVSDEEEKLLKLANKLHMNTNIRKSIFLVLMSSRDVIDAYERLNRIELKGKQDRDIIRVIVECCSKEKDYNFFYTELLLLYCKSSRQTKTTLQYIYWDLFKQLSNDLNLTNSNTQKCVNLSKVLAQLIIEFHLTFNIIKVIDMTEITKPLELFLKTLFLEIFNKNVKDDKFQTLFDRIAASNDYALTRDTLLLFLQTHFKSNDSNIDQDNWSLIIQRRKIAISTLKSMEVLDFARIEVK